MHTAAVLCCCPVEAAMGDGGVGKCGHVLMKPSQTLLEVGKMGFGCEHCHLLAALAPVRVLGSLHTTGFRSPGNKCMTDVGFAMSWEVGTHVYSLLPAGRISPQRRLALGNSCSVCLTCEFMGCVCDWQELLLLLITSAVLKKASAPGTAALPKGSHLVKSNTVLFKM